MFAELDTSEGRHALGMKGRCVTFDRLLKTPKLMSCIPCPPLDTTRCSSLCDVFFLFFWLKLKRPNIRKWCFKNAFWCFCHLPQIKSAPLFSPKQTWDYIPWRNFCKSRVCKLCWPLQIWWLKPSVHTGDNSRLWKSPFLLQHCQGIFPMTGRDTLQSPESWSVSLLSLISCL